MQEKPEYMTVEIRFEISPDSDSDLAIRNALIATVREIDMSLQYSERSEQADKNLKSSIITAQHLLKALLSTYGFDERI